MTRTHLTVDVNSVFHLPGKHNQKSHGNRAGKKDNVSGKTSKHAPISPDITPAEVTARVNEIHEDNAAAPPASPNALLSPFEFEDQVGAAAAGEDAFQELPFPNWNDVTRHMSVNDGMMGDTPERTVLAGVGNYKEGGFVEINNSLRFGRKPRDLDDPNSMMWERSVHGMDAVMAESRTKNDIVVYRGIDSPIATFGDAWRNFGDNTGLEWTDEGFTSTTVDERVISKFVDDEAGGVRMRILVPAGTRAFTPDRAAGQSRDSEEREIIINRGGRYRVVRDYRDYDEENDVDTRIIDVEVVS